MEKTLKGQIVYKNNYGELLKTDEGEYYSIDKYGINQIEEEIGQHLESLGKV